MEFWFQNATYLQAMTTGFTFTTANGAPIVWNTYGTYGAPAPALMQVDEAASLGSFNLGGWQAPTTLMPAQFLTGGAALSASAGLPPHAVSTRVFSLSLNASGLTDIGVGDEFCVDNTFYPPAGTWTFDNGTGGYAPTFQGQPNTSESNPDAPAVCFDVYLIPCLPPVFTADPGAAPNKNHCSAFTFNFDATEGGNGSAADPVTFATSAGTINAATGELSVPALAACGTTPVTVTATNACGSFLNFDFTINWTNNVPTITNCPAPISVGKGNPVSYDLNSTDADPCDAAVWTIVADDPVVNAPSISGLGVFSWLSDVSEGGTVKNFTATVTDPCGGSASCNLSFIVLNTQPFVIQIEKTHGTFQGNFEYVSITKVAGSELMGGFDFLVAYDASALSFFSASLGAALGPAGCGWEYFTFRYGAQGNCGGPCPSGLLRVVAIADANNGANHPSCFSVADGAELVSLKFYVTNDRTFECMYVPIRFAWLDCGDNGISNVGGDTLWISDKVFDFENTDPLNDNLYEITDMSCYFAIAYGGACSTCDVSMKYEPIRFILFWNGGVDIACADSIDAPGDLNLNDIAYEIADAVLYTNYFLYGLSALDANPQYREAQIAASDANQDGSVLTVGDLVYLLRVVIGDALPYAKLAPFANSATVSVVNGVVATDASVEVGGVYATFKVNGAYDLTSNTDMTVISAENEGLVKVLVYAGLENMSNRLEAGHNNLFTLSGDAELVSVEVADFNGAMLNTRINKSVLPTEFKLSQNTPNPFNPTTKIGLDLPTASDWNLDIYNVAGQLVKSFNGRGVGNVSVEWDATNVASGIYFYKATAGAFTATKKMVLMK
ncbi:MAG: T9SS type A sorting domain-containing protein [Candidatus Zixiibacteriota bacterium]